MLWDWPGADLRLPLAPQGSVRSPLLPTAPQTPQSTPEPSWCCSSPGDKAVRTNLPPFALKEAAQEHPIPLSPRLQGQTVAFGSAVPAGTSHCPLRPEHPPALQNHPQDPRLLIPSRNPGHSHRSWGSETVGSHPGITRGWVAGAGHEWCQHDVGVLEAEGEKEKPGLSHFLDLCPKGRIPGHLLGRPQLCWSQMGGKEGEEGRKERGGEEMDKREGEREG